MMIDIDPMKLEINQTTLTTQLLTHLHKTLQSTARDQRSIVNRKEESLREKG